MRTRLVFPVIACLIIAACAGAETASPASSSAPTTAAVTDTPAPADTAATTAPSSTVDPDLPTYTEVRDAAVADGSDGGAALALAELDALIGLSGVDATFAADRGLPSLGTDALTALARHWDDLDEAQQTAVIERLDELGDLGTTVYSSSTDADYQAVVAELGGEPDAAFDGALSDDSDQPDGLVRPQGLRAAPARIEADDAAALARAAAIVLQRRLGGPGLNFDLNVLPAGVAPTPSTDAITVVDIFVIGSLRDDDSRRCRIDIFDHDRLVGARLNSVMIHEMFHCWTYTNVEATVDHNNLPEFFAEGMATWVGENSVGGSSFGDFWLDVYFAQPIYPLYRAEYSAFGWWSQIQQLEGDANALWRRIPSMLDDHVRGPTTGYARSTTGHSLEEWVALSTNSALRDDLGANFDISFVGGRSGREIFDRPVQGRDVAPQFVGPAEHGIFRYPFTDLDGEGPWVLEVATTGFANLRWESGDEYQLAEATVDRFCVGGECICPDDTRPFGELSPPPGDSSELIIGLIGSPESDSSSQVEATDMADICEPSDEPLDLGDGDVNDVVGVYRAQPEAIAQMFREASGFGVGSGESLDIAGASGDLLMTLRPDGTGRLDYNNVVIVFNSGPLPSMTIGGGGEFVYGLDGVLRISGTDYELAVTADILGTEPLTLSDDDLPGGGGVSEFSFQFADSRLVLDSLGGSTGEVFFPLVWFKQ